MPLQNIKDSENALSPHRGYFDILHDKMTEYSLIQWSDGIH